MRVASCESDDTETRNSANPSAELVEAMNRLLSVSTAEGGRLRYDALRKTPPSDEVERIARSLRRFRMERRDGSETCPHEEKTAFWLNAYNALAVHGILDGSRRAAYEIGGEIFYLDDIRHDILRANRPKYPFLPSRPFGKNDPRNRHTLDSCDPRIHFALIDRMALHSPIPLYEAMTLDAQLEHACRSFLNAPIILDMVANILTVSPLFRQYAHDFGRSRVDIVRFILLHLDDADAQGYLREHLLTTRLKYRVDIPSES